MPGSIYLIWTLQDFHGILGGTGEAGSQWPSFLMVVQFQCQRQVLMPVPGEIAWQYHVSARCQVPGVVLGESGLASCLMVVLAKQPVAAFRGCWSHSLTCLDGTAAVAPGQPTDNLCSSQTKPDRGTFLDISTFLTATLWYQHLSQTLPRKVIFLMVDFAIFLSSLPA